MYIRRLSSSLTLECHTAASQENIRRKHCFAKIRQPSYFLSREDLAGIIAAIEGTIGDGFEHVLLLDVLCAFQIGYRARDFQYTVIRTRREAQLGHRELQQLV